ncbi:rhodanese-related sulfurtransferase [Allocatelliglobosispora scoriae]|uniref:Rhodanese-related sulfurtransferase n=1 Tax=Allocatelliglobosispora scoriae TaxID=643052 RepID=A0A841BPH5_9ACTN|nr:rhodanese-like domain-containing protein [Allocatelliglobosispora scoriae]MBB5869089.1 rhodanese-related sulfurtransferase [Allocatelliglobosispora scoriae]
MTTATTTAADPATAIAHFSAKLSFETDVSDVHAALAAGTPGIVVVDTRSLDGWEQGHVPGAVHLPTAEIAARAPAEIDPAALVVTYCWGPACNGSTRAALEFAKLGFRVKEMIGGYEYWVREGFDTRGLLGLVQHDVDPLTAPASGAACAC